MGFVNPWDIKGVLGMDVKVDDNQIMTIVIDLKKDQGLSGSGKNHLVASTKGNKYIPNAPAGKEDYILGVNLYHPVKK